jgi:hypothetical protein
VNRHLLSKRLDRLQGIEPVPEQQSDEEGFIRGVVQWHGDRSWNLRVGSAMSFTLHASAL